MICGSQQHYRGTQSHQSYPEPMFTGHSRKPQEDATVEFYVLEHGQLSMLASPPVVGELSKRWHIRFHRRHGLIRPGAGTMPLSMTAAFSPLCWVRRRPPTAPGPAPSHRTQDNLEALEQCGLSRRIQFRKLPGRGLSEPQANSARLQIRPGIGIEHVFAAQKHRGRSSCAPSAGTAHGGARHGQLGVQLRPLDCSEPELCQESVRLTP